ncbi:DNA-binding transcriptional regulator, AcrR family [Arthrobacter alpinus]|uniref:DNA-binding transcriptional regulator, AcrR family n=1 Tax=Arthrobacter alpinus TaxID=656366 RepID=A0A1H5PA20_9MICC|nr:TetR/AcrR family transcriptional regulator [Arthrobacter alpinus]SEF10666.1 DNA-binding transcriptional regulator, AcrR family [Arthrobacter alpinus]
MHEKHTTGSRKKGRPSEDEREERKTAILDAATELFIRNGYGQTTVDQLATAAQVTKRTIYSYFGDKAVVFTAVIERFRRDTVTRSKSSGESLEDICTKIVHALHSDQAVGLHRLMIAEAVHFPALSAAFYASGPLGYMESIAASLPRSVPQTEMPFMSETVFSLLLGEKHRQRLLGLAPAPDRETASKHAAEALRALGLSTA